YAVSPTNSSPSESSTGIGDDPSLESASSWSSARVESTVHPYLWNQWWARSRATLGSAQAPCGVLPTRTSRRDRLGYSGSSLGSAATRAALAESSAINISTVVPNAPALSATECCDATGCGRGSGCIAHEDVRPSHTIPSAFARLTPTLPIGRRVWSDYFVHTMIAPQFVVELPVYRAGTASPSRYTSIP